MSYFWIPDVTRPLQFINQGQNIFCSPIKLSSSPYQFSALFDLVPIITLTHFAGLGWFVCSHVIPEFLDMEKSICCFVCIPFIALNMFYLVHHSFLTPLLLLLVLSDASGKNSWSFFRYLIIRTGRVYCILFNVACYQQPLKMAYHDCVPVLNKNFFPFLYLVSTITICWIFIVPSMSN